MKRLKQILTSILCVCNLMGLAACGQPQPQKLQENKMNIICTIFPAYDFTRELVGERANVVLLMPPGAESHSYEPSPQDMTALIHCDLIVANGGVDESWLEKMIAAGEIRTPVLRMLDCVNLYEEETREGMQSVGHDHDHEEHDHEEHDHDHEHEAEYDEHVWTSPVNAALICRELCQRLCRIDPQGEEIYRKKTEDYCSKLMELDRRFRSLTENAPHKLMIFADRFPVRYFVEEYGLDYYAAFPGCAEDAEPSARTVAFLIDRVREKHIPAVYYIEFSNQKMADIVAEDTGCRKMLFHSCHNVSAQELAEGVSYLELMENNYENLKGGLSEWQS